MGNSSDQQSLALCCQAGKKKPQAGTSQRVVVCADLSLNLLGQAHPLAGAHQNLTTHTTGGLAKRCHCT
jgi:hypothetical protein